MFDESNSLSLTNLPDIIWLTSLGGTGEKPGATTNDCSKTGKLTEESAVGRSPAATLKSEEATEGAGGEKVETNDGTTKFGLQYRLKVWTHPDAAKPRLCRVLPPRVHRG